MSEKTLAKYKVQVKTTAHFRFPVNLPKFRSFLAENWRCDTLLNRKDGPIFRTGWTQPQSPPDEHPSRQSQQ